MSAQPVSPSHRGGDSWWWRGASLVVGLLLGAVFALEALQPGRRPLAMVQEMAPPQAESSASTEPLASAAPRAGPPGPSVAFLVAGLQPDERPPWASATDALLRYDPPSTCPACPAGAPRYGGSDRGATGPAWWCAQRHYLDGLMRLLQTFPGRQFYFLVDARTAVFPSALRALLRLLETEVLQPSEDLYLGHSIKLGNIGQFVMFGGGVLLRGQTLRRAASNGTLARCSYKHVRGQWCWKHWDWVLADCLRRLGVQARGHAAFQQAANDCQCCQAPAVACHPVNISQQERLSQEHSRFDVQTLTAAWAAPCPHEVYSWRSAHESVCNRTARGRGRHRQQASR